MATGNIKLSALPTLAVATASTIFPVVDSGATQTVTGTVLKSFISSGDLDITGNLTVTGNIVNSPTFAQLWSNANITIASINTPYTIPLNNIGSHSLVSLGTGASNSRVIINKTGTYNIAFSVQIRKSSAKTDSVFMWFRKNGVDIADSNGVFSIDRAQDVIQGWDIVDTVETVGDYYEIVWASTDNTTTMPTIAANSAGFTMPASPSVIVTVTPVGA